MDFKTDGYDIIIIGSGVGGLFAGARLAHAGYDVLILERLTRIGGRKTSIDYKGFQVATGAIHYHIYGDNGPEAQTLRELGVKWKSFPCNPHTIWQIGNKRYPMPEKGAMPYQFKLAGLSDKEAEHLAKVFIRGIKWKVPSEKLNFKDWLEQYTDNKCLMAMYDSFVANITGHWSDKLSAGEFVEEMKHLSTTMSVIPGGNKGLVDALHGVLLKHGAEIRLRTRVREIIIEEGRAEGVVVETEDGKVLDLKSKVVISDAGPRRTVDLAGREKFDIGFLKEVDELEPAGPCLFIIYVDDKPLFDTPGCLSIPYEFGGCRRVSTISLPSLACRELDAPGKYAHYFWALCQGDVEEEIKIAKEDVKSFFPKDYDEEKILLIQCYKDELPSYGSIPGTGIDTKTSAENLYLVGDGNIPSGYLGGEGCAVNAKYVAEDIKKRLKLT